MAEDYGYIDAFKYYRRAQSRFDYFFIGVILASFSLSIQTFNPLAYYSSVYLMVLTWVLLLVSFLSGLFRIERINMSLRVEADNLSFRSKKEIFDKGKLGEIILHKTRTDIWQPEELTNEISTLNSFLDKSKNLMITYNKQTLRAYQVQKWCFIIAIFSYALFKLTNIYHFNHLVEILSLFSILVASFIIVKFYKKTLQFSGNK